MEITKILALTDLSPASRVGLDMADTLAARAGGKVDVGYIAQPVPGPRPAVEEPLVRKVEGLLRTEEERGLADVAAQCVDATRRGELHRLYTECVRCGIRDLIARVRPDLVCLSVRGRATAANLALGSIAEHTARTAGVPVLLVRGPALPPPGSPLRVLLGVDLIEPPDATAARVRPLLRQGDELVLAHVLETHIFFPPALGLQPALTGAQLDTMTAKARSLLGDVTLGAQGPQVAVRVERGEPAAMLIHLAEHLGSHIVAVRAHATRLHDPLLLGRHSGRVARAAPVSVLVC